MSPILQVSGLGRRFGGIVVADAIDFELNAGEVVGLIGPNGAGKTTLFNLMTGFVTADTGSVSLHGRRIEGLPPLSARASRNRATDFFADRRPRRCSCR